MQKNTAGKWVVFAFEDEGGSNPGEPVTGDAANITANIRIDGAAANAVDDTNPTELEDGYYIFDITAAEANGDNLLLCPQSSTANVNVIGVPGAVWTTPPYFNVLGIESDGDLTKVNMLNGHTAQTGDSYAALPTNFSTMMIDANGRLDISLIEGADATTQIYSSFNGSIQAYGLDHLVQAAVTGADIANNSIIAKLVSKSATADWDDFDNTTDSMQALRDRGDAAWTTADVATALATYDPPTKSEMDSALAASWSTDTLTEAYAADGAEGTPAQILYQIQQALTEFAISSTTLTVNKLDGTTPAATYTLDDADAPTSRTRAT